MPPAYASSVPDVAADASQPSLVLPLSAAKIGGMSTRDCGAKKMHAHLVVLYPRYATRRYSSPLFVRADPELGMDLVFWDDFASEDVPHEKVIVHRLGNDLCDRRRLELNESVMF